MSLDINLLGDEYEKCQYSVERDFATGMWYVINSNGSGIVKPKFATVESALALASWLVIRDMQIDWD
jgi:hypothetical protein